MEHCIGRRPGDLARVEARRERYAVSLESARGQPVRLAQALDVCQGGATEAHEEERCHQSTSCRGDCSPTLHVATTVKLTEKAGPVGKFPQ